MLIQGHFKSFSIEDWRLTPTGWLFAWNAVGGERALRSPFFLAMVWTNYLF